MKGLLEYTEDPIVSPDIVKNPASSILDSQLTAVMDGTMVKVVSWYDNEWGYSNRIVELVQKLYREDAGRPRRSRGQAGACPG